MKKLFLAVMAVATIAMVGCKKDDGNTPVIPGGQGGGGDEPAQTEEAPEVAAPAAGSVTFVIQIPEGTECNGIAFKGTRNGAWTDCSGKDTYIGENAENVPAAQCIKFEKIEGTKTWFKATYKLGTEAWGDDNVLFAGKVCLIYTNDESWEGQAKEWEYVESYCTATYSTSNDGNIQVSASGLVYVKISAWNKSECVAVVLKDRHIVLTVPENDCAAEVPTVVGSFNSWNAVELPMTLVEGRKYEITIKAEDSDQFKFGAATSGWNDQIQVYDAEKDEWGDNPNIDFGSETEFNIDYSAGKWKACAE